MKQPTVLQVLIKADQLLATPSRWIKGRLAQRELHAPTRYCMLGAIYAASDKLTPEVRLELIDECCKALVDHYEADVPCEESARHSLAAFNDAPRRTFEEVKAAFRTAIDERKA